VPYKPPEHFLSMYDAMPYAGPVDFKRTNELLEKIKVGSIKLNGRDKERLAALYDGEISYHDVHFAAIMKGLEERGIAGETMVVITADHGEEFWDHGSVGHGHSVYDELLHIPLIVRVPGLTQHKQRVPDSVGLLDVMPTILDALGQEIPEALPGRSFLPELRGQASSAPRAVPSGFMTGWRTLAVGRYKLIQRTLDKSTLYDTQADPSETRDLAPERPLLHRYTRALLGLTLAEQAGQSEPVRRARSPAGEKTVIDPNTAAQLRALGYVGTSSPGEARASPPR
jgi:arylsulfatase A-like enzyme